MVRSEEERSTRKWMPGHRSRTYAPPMPRLDPLFWIMAIAVLALASLVLLLLRERARTTARRREELSDRREIVERARIARELHDVVAHGVSVMTLGVGAGRMIMDKDAARARETLRGAEETGRQVLAELQRMLSLLSGFTGPPPARTPQPRLSDLGDLLERVRCSGLSVDLVSDGTPANVGQGLELSAYRIVQEALENSMAHARSATVTLRWRPGFLDVLVRDDGHAGAPVTPGMRHRAALFGGSLTGGAELHARLPTDQH